MGNVVDEVMNLLVREKPGSMQMAAPDSNQSRISVQEKILKKYTGWYRNTRTGDALQLYLKGGKLAVSNAGFQMVPEGPLTALDERTFIMPYIGKVIVRPNNKLLFIQSPRDTIVYIRVSPATLDLQGYAGEYYSDEAQVKLSISLKGKALMLERSPHDTATLASTYTDGFYYWFGSICFERNKQGEIAGFSVSVPRARNIHFKRL